MKTKQIQHSPGPWKHWEVNIPFKGWEIISANNQGIARTPNTKETDKANAELIAAAPELLQELKDLLEWADESNGETAATSRWPQAHAAIAKAEGAAQ